MNVFIVITALVVAGALALTPQLRRSTAWKATVTPLSSIMGSGFLVSAPLVATEVGVYAPFAMIALLVVAFAIGAIIRFNIRFAEPDGSDSSDGSDSDSASAKQHRAHRSHHERSLVHWRALVRHPANTLEQISHVVLAGAYIISVTYYLQLLSAFVLDRFGVTDLLISRAMTTAILVGITGVGAIWGLRMLERLEGYTVALNLGMITALLLALLVHDGSLAASGDLALPDLARDQDLGHSARVLMGLLIVVQGFETSRFLGAEHSKAERVRTMRIAQLISSVIYVAFIGLTLPLFHPGKLDANVTAIVHVVAPVAMVLPLLIVVTSVASQFSAAVADDAACAGLLNTFFVGRLAPRWGYLAIGVGTIALTWLSDVLTIISLASRAFALFYAFQCAVALATAWTGRELPRRRLVMVGATGLGLLALAIVLFGVSAE